MQRVKGLLIGLIMIGLSLPVLPDLVQAQSQVPIPPGEERALRAAQALPFPRNSAARNR